MRNKVLNGSRYWSTYCSLFRKASIEFEFLYPDYLVADKDFNVYFTTCDCRTSSRKCLKFDT